MMIRALFRWTEKSPAETGLEFVAGYLGRNWTAVRAIPTLLHCSLDGAGTRPALNPFDEPSVLPEALAKAPWAERKG